MESFDEKKQPSVALQNAIRSGSSPVMGETRSVSEECGWKNVANISVRD